MNELFDNSYSTHLFELDVSKIYVRQVKTSVIQQIQPKVSKAIWRPAPGRKLGFLVEHDEHLLGVAFLSSPVINLRARDEFLEMPKSKTEKGKELRHYADLSVCVALQPFGWHWNGGKLIALIATTFGNAWQERYGEKLKGICTTSLWGRGSQYNRIYKFLGYTQGFGHQHIDDDSYQRMMDWMKTNGHPIPSSRFGAGSNPRMRRIAAYRKASGDKTVTLKHGLKRGIYYHAAELPENRQQVIQHWYQRWGIPRYTRTKDLIPPYTTGIETKER